MIDENSFDRAYGTLLGQCIGDALGAQVEFSSRATIHQRYPGGVREMTGGGPHNTLPGQITDDSELALALARAIVEKGHFEPHTVAQAYVDWKRSGPFDCGGTCGNAFGGQFDETFPMADQVHWNAIKAKTSQANGALMRVSPIGVSTVQISQTLCEQFAMDDAALSHVHPNCQIASAVLAVGIRSYILGFEEESLRRAFEVARRKSIEFGHDEVFDWINEARTEPSKADSQIGWVRHGITAAIHFALHAKSFEEGIVETINLGGDTDTNAAIVGALLGAKFGAKQIPERWIKPVLEVEARRPEVYRTNDLPALAEALLTAPSTRERTG